MSETKTCFVISPIGPEHSNTRTRSDDILHHIIIPVVQDELEYTVVRADKVAQPGDINDQIIEYLKDAHLVIADLTESNPNVYYELAIRHITNKPCVTMAQAGTDIPFDVSTYRYVPLNHPDWNSIEHTKIELRKFIFAAVNNPENIYNPISKSALSQLQSMLLRLERSEPSSDQNTLKLIVQQLDSMTGILSILNHRISNVERTSQAAPFLGTTQYTGGAAIFPSMSQRVDYLSRNNPQQISEGARRIQEEVAKLNQSRVEHPDDDPFNPMNGEPYGNRPGEPNY